MPSLKKSHQTVRRTLRATERDLDNRGKSCCYGDRSVPLTEKTKTNNRLRPFRTCLIPLQDKVDIFSSEWPITCKTTMNRTLMERVESVVVETKRLNINLCLN